jgi:hypothetical protein
LHAKYHGLKTNNIFSNISITSDKYSAIWRRVVMYQLNERQACVGKIW